MTTWTNTVKNFVSWIWGGLVSAYNLDGNSTDSAGSNNGTDTGIQYVAGKIGQAAQFSGISTSGLVSYYKLDANSNDSVGSNNGTDTAISYATAGIIGNSATFNGTTSTIKVASFVGLPIGASARGVFVWIKTTSTALQFFFGYGSNVTGETFSLGLNNGKLYFGGFGTADFTGNISINDGNWHNVGVTYDGTTVKLYVDNVLDTSALRTLNTVATDLYIGSINGTSIFTGSLDELAIFSRAPSASEIFSLFNSGAARALQYFGSSIQASATPIITATSPWSVSFFAKTGNLNQTFAMMFANGDANSSGFQITQDGAHLKISLGGVGNWDTGIGFTDTTSFNHIVVTYDGITIRSYVNLVAGTTSILTPLTPSGATTMGTSHSGSYNWNGLLDMFYIYNRALTAGEMAELNNQGNGIQYPNIPSIWTNETY
jgi:hypothetical protein